MSMISGGCLHTRHWNAAKHLWSCEASAA